MVHCRVIAAKWMVSCAGDADLVQAVFPSRQVANVRENRPGPSLQTPWQALHRPGSNECPARSRGINDKVGRDGSDLICLAQLKRPVSRRLSARGYQVRFFKQNGSGSGCLARQKVIDVCSEPLSVSDVIADACRDEQLVGIVIVGRKWLVGLVCKVRKASLQSAPDLRPFASPGAVPGQSFQIGQVVRLCEATQNEVCCWSGGLADRKPRVSSIVDQNGAQPRLLQDPGDFCA